MQFQEDTSPESEENEFIRYISQSDTPCESCAQAMLINLAVWEHPESVANYSYCSSGSVSAIACEFSIEHYFNDEIATHEGDHVEPEADVLDEDDSEDKVFNGVSVQGAYADHYDPED